MGLSLRLSFHNLRFNFLIIIMYAVAKHNKNFHQESCKILIRLEALLIFIFISLHFEGSYSHCINCIFL